MEIGGGNDFHIEPIRNWGDRPIRNLHALWDFGCGEFLPLVRPLSSNSNATIETLAVSIMREYPRKSLVQISRAQAILWANEGSFYAKKVVYNLRENTKPTDEYLRKGRALCRQRAAYAGYRLADLLNRVLAD